MENDYYKLADLSYEALFTVANQLALKGHRDQARVVIMHMMTKWPERVLKNQGIKGISEMKQNGGDLNVTS